MTSCINQEYRMKGVDPDICWFKLEVLNLLTDLMTVLALI